MIRDWNKLEPQEDPTDLKDLISYDMYSILSRKLFPSYDARAVLKDLDKMVAINSEDLVKFITKNTPQKDKSKVKLLLSLKGWTDPISVQMDAVELYDMEHAVQKESIFRQMVNKLRGE